MHVESSYSHHVTPCCMNITEILRYGHQWQSGCADGHGQLLAKAPHRINTAPCDRRPSVLKVQPPPTPLLPCQLLPRLKALRVGTEGRHLDLASHIVSFMESSASSARQLAALLSSNEEVPACIRHPRDPSAQLPKAKLQSC